MTDIKSRALESVGILVEYFEAKWNVMALDVSDKSAKVISSILMGVTLALLGFFVLVLLSISAALAVGYWLDNFALGFLIIALAYLLVCVIVVYFRFKLLYIPFINIILKILYKEDRNGN